MPRDNSNYVSYSDVMNALKDVADTWGVRLQIVMGLTPQPCKGIDCYVRLAMFQKDDQGRWVDRGGLSHYWPTPDHKTMTGLMLALIYQWDAACQRDEELDLEKRSAARQRRMF